jgi:hypothetical protein
METLPETARSKREVVVLVDGAEVRMLLVVRVRDERERGEAVERETVEPSTEREADAGRFKAPAKVTLALEMERAD